MKKKIYLQRIGDIDPGILIILKKDLKRFFKKYRIKIVVLPDQLPLLESEFESYDRHYDGIEVKKRLITRIKNKTYHRIIGVMDLDIFTKKLEKIYGVADQPKKKKSFGRALITVTRLREEFYGRTKNIALFEQRVVKEAIHELGHTFGLEHCENLCVMRFSNSLEDADKKPLDYCDVCLKKLNLYLGKSNKPNL
ncbi:MAG: archaemetzincin family Zn-dependent metalloprotease [Promethearchaeota archaeon]